MTAGVPCSRKERRKARSRRGKRGIPAVVTFITIIALAVILFSGYFIFQYIENSRQQSLHPGTEPHLYFMGQESSAAPFYMGEDLYLPFDFVKEKLDPTLTWDEKNGLVIITTPEDVYHLTPESGQGLRNLKPYQMEAALIWRNKTVFFPASLAAKLYCLEITENEDRHFVNVSDPRQPLQTGTASRDVKIRHQPGLFSPWIEKIRAGAELEIFREENGWYWVGTDKAQLGYLPEGAVTLSGVSSGVEPPGTSFQPFNPPGQPILLTWEFVLKKTADTDSIGDLDGVHVLSPIWFHLREDGEVESNADMRYVDWAHRQGRQVWCIFSNDCEIDLTHTFLGDAELRIRALRQLLEYVERYELDGIDVDFEYMYMEDKEAYVQFIRELTPLMHELGRTVTVDVIFHSDSERWSRCYDHKKLAEIADYLIVMAYDQHTVLAGSVAALPWVEKGVIRMLEDVPAHKLMLGVPFYTRLWAEKTGANGNIDTSRTTLTMEQAENWVREHGPTVREDHSAGQHYVELTEGTTTYRMWLEDFYSLEKRVALMKKYRLAGMAAWRRGIEKAEIWPALSNLIDRRW